VPGLEDHTIIPTRRGYIRQALERIEVFSSVSPELLDEVASEFRSADAAAGEAVVRQNDPGDQLFVIESGELEATAVIGARTVKLGQLKAGDFFGEFALLKGSKRTATVTALTPVRLWTLSAKSLNELCAKSPALAANIRNVMRKRELANAFKALQ
jgi:CPA2 family monovalent cation:H+ antiporter-2